MFTLQFEDWVVVCCVYIFLITNRPQYVVTDYE